MLNDDRTKRLPDTMLSAFVVMVVGYVVPIKSGRGVSNGGLGLGSRFAKPLSSSVVTGWES